MTLLAIDGGASSTKWLLQDALGNPIAKGSLPPLHGHIYGPEEKHKVRLTLTELKDTIPASIWPNQIVAGIAGLTVGSATTRWYFDEIHDLFGLTANDILVVDDLGIVFLGNFDPGRNFVLYAGTGAIAYHISRDFYALRAGGFGYLIDDAGSGFWIGKKALAAVLVSLEAGAPIPTTPLFQKMEIRFGTLDWPILKNLVYEGGRSLIASLSQEVRVSAELEDPIAVKILNDAGHELAGLANRLASHMGPEIQEIAFIGGVSRIGAPLTSSLTDQLGQHLCLASSPVEGPQAMCQAVAKHGISGLCKILGQV